MKTFDDLVAICCAAIKAAVFLSLTLILIPVALMMRRTDPEHPFKLPMMFHRLLLRLIGVQVRVTGEPAQPSPVLFVANHVSYLDIPILGSLVPAGFIAKAEVANWPLFGILARLQNSVFFERRSTRAADQCAQMQNYFSKNQSLILFAEGTSSDGLDVLPFKSSLFGIIENSANGLPIAVQPVSVTCVELDGFPMLREERATYGWYGDILLIPHLWGVFQHRSFGVEVVFHPPMTSAEISNRKELAVACQKKVAEGVKQSLERRCCPV